MTPNHTEAAGICGMDSVETDQEVDTAGKFIIAKYKCPYVLITRGEKGLSLITSKKTTYIPTVAQTVFDVSGAGDTVISTLTIGLAAGADIYEASFLANYAAGVVCGEVGIVPIEKDKLFETVLKDNL